MAKVHFILQGKGGVGKSMIASTLVQYLLSKLLNVLCIDTDPVNNTLAGYKAFGATVLKIMSGDNVNSRMFDKLIEMICSAEENTHIVIDNGASSFIPLMSYLKENNAIQLLQEMGHEVFMHTVITGGQATPDTVAGLASLCKSFTNTKLVVWLNYYFGNIVHPTEPDKYFEDFIVYQENHEKFHALIQIPSKNTMTFGKDVEELLARRETFEAAINSSLPIMARQRLKTYWHEMVAELDKANLFEAA